MSDPQGGFVDHRGRRFYRIDGYDRMEPFLMTLASPSDVWCFVSSSGGLTAGRVDADRALFPYDTEDTVTESAGRSGGLTLLRVRTADDEPVLWEPVTAADDAGVARRALLKDALGTTVVFEEHRPDLGLRARVTWSASSGFGLVREVELTCTADHPARFDVLDGLVNLLPAGVTVDTQRRLSPLLDAYKRTEVDPVTGLGLVHLSSRLTDLAEPSECLLATTAWHVGLGRVEHVLRPRQVTAFRRGQPVAADREVRGERGTYLVSTTRELAPGGTLRWLTVADVEQDAAQVVRLRELLADHADAARAVADDVARTRAELEDRLASADSLQVGGDEEATAHHSANVLFNVLRGGVPAGGYDLDAADVRRFVEQRSSRTARRCRRLLDGLPARLPHAELVRAARAHGDPDLERLATEYMPLTLSRRHGDPSRPWNRFRIAVRDGHGRPLLDHQGNWRDIFQNWEATARSFPEYLTSMVTVFLAATTVDGYNPYRISRDGVDWEVPDPDDPWANIGYWSDHQVIYLARLLEASEQHHPGRLREALNRPLLPYADVPYRLAGYAETLRDPQSTVTYDVAHAAVVAARETEEGADGRLVHDAAGDLVRVGLGEKLLLILLAKLVNLVPDGGIWMNTQRPEWNDANNALVGRGLSVVTLGHLLRFLALLDDLLVGDVVVREDVATLAHRVVDVLAEHVDAVQAGLDPAGRHRVLDALGAAGSDYRARVYAEVRTGTEVLGAAPVRRLLALARRYVETALRANRRPDGLFHSYNLLHRDEAGAHVRRLPEMLEGQVSVLGSGLLGPDEALALLRALRGSRLYRPDQHSYLLYPDRDLPGFLARNTLTDEQVAAAPLVGELAASGDRSVVVRDGRGAFHFAGGLRNAADLTAALDLLREHPDLGPRVKQGAQDVLTVFEQVFRHDEFTGRAGSFFAYEGLGSVYWHMVSKLQLAVLELLVDHIDRSGPSGDRDGGRPRDETAAALAEVYRDVRAGLGYRRDPAGYGAFPTDPYSHTPAAHGARQPGMTGQVKEEVLARSLEMGLRVRDGRVVLRPVLPDDAEALTEPRTLQYLDVRGRRRDLPVPAGSMAFTYCQTPVRVAFADTDRVRVRLRDGADVDCPDGVLPRWVSRSLFRREGLVDHVDVTVATAAPAAGPAHEPEPEPEPAPSTGRS
ncbi:hypothetical protein [Thalassiella azotivora]